MEARTACGWTAVSEVGRPPRASLGDLRTETAEASLLKHTPGFSAVTLGARGTRRHASPKAEKQSEFFLSDSMSSMSRWLPSGRGWPESCLSPSFLCSPGTSWRRWYVGLRELPPWELPFA